MSPDAKNQVKSLVRAFDVIEALWQLETTGVTELADHTGLPASTVHSYLSTLVDRGYVLREDHSYRLAARFIHLGDYVKYNLDIYRAGERIVRELAETTGESVNLIVEEGGRGIYVHCITGKKGLQNYSDVRRREYLHSTAAGKAILSKLSDERVDDIVDTWGLPSRTANTITRREELSAALERCRENGVAFNDEENTEGIRAVGAPIKIENGTYGALSVSGPISRFSKERVRDELPKHVRNAAKSIEVDLV